MRCCHDKPNTLIVPIDCLLRTWAIKWEIRERPILCLGRDLQEGHSYMKYAIHPQYTKFLMIVIRPSVRMRTSYLDSPSCELQAAVAPAWLR